MSIQYSYWMQSDDKVRYMYIYVDIDEDRLKWQAKFVVEYIYINIPWYRLSNFNLEKIADS